MARPGPDDHPPHLAPRGVDPLAPIMPHSDRRPPIARKADPRLTVDDRRHHVSRAVKAPVADNDRPGRVLPVDDHRHAAHSRYGNRRRVVGARGTGTANAGDHRQDDQGSSQSHCRPTQNRSRIDRRILSERFMSSVSKRAAMPGMVNAWCLARYATLASAAGERDNGTMALFGFFQRRSDDPQLSSSGLDQYSRRHGQAHRRGRYGGETAIRLKAPPAKRRLAAAMGRC